MRIGSGSRSNNTMNQCAHFRHLLCDCHALARDACPLYTSNAQLAFKDILQTYISHIMDDMRDTRGSMFSKLLDSVVHTNPFGKNRLGDRMYRRAERLTAAVFLMTNHIPPDESLKIEVRKSSSLLLQKALACRHGMRSSTSVAVEEFQVSVRHLISLIRLLVFSGFISPQNADVVANAADELGTFVSTASRSSLSEAVPISKADLLNVPDFYKGQKDRIAVKDISPVKDSLVTSNRSPLNSIDDATLSLTPRGTGIIDILHSGEQLNIRDIAANLPEYSEKTIQRELASLIQKGVVKRIGHKRWSRYSLVRSAAGQ